MQLNTIWFGRIMMVLVVVAGPWGANVLAAERAEPFTGSFVVRERKTTEQRVTESYDKGLKHQERAWQHRESALASDSDKSRKKLVGKANKELKKALKNFDKARRLQPTFYQAHSSSGYTLKELGKFAEAVVAFDTCLSLSAEYTPAIEYRAEAHLALGRLEEVREAYAMLVGLDPTKAEQLMATIDAWVSNPPSNTSEAAVEQMSAWVASAPVRDQSGVAD